MHELKNWFNLLYFFQSMIYLFSDVSYGYFKTKNYQKEIHRILIIFVFVFIIRFLQNFYINETK
jgi:hypothetical protein